MGMDLGVDGVAALFGAQYLFSLNVEGFPDPSHGATIDVVNATTQLSLTSLWLLGLVSWNLPWPSEEEHRFNQLRECLRDQLLPEEQLAYEPVVPDLRRRLGGLLPKGRPRLFVGDERGGRGVDPLEEAHVRLPKWETMQHEQVSRLVLRVPAAHRVMGDRPFTKGSCTRWRSS